MRRISGHNGGEPGEGSLPPLSADPYFQSEHWGGPEVEMGEGCLSLVHAEAYFRSLGWDEPEEGSLAPLDAELGSEAVGWDDPELWEGEPGEHLSRVPVGPLLVAHLGRTDFESCSDEGLFAALEAAEKLEAHAAALKARAAAALADRASMHGRDRYGEVAFGAEEVAMTLGITRQGAERLIGVGRHLIGKGPLHVTAGAFSSGRISLVKAQTIVTRLADVPVATALAVEDLVVPDAPRRTVRQLERDIARALVEVDPTDADRRHQAARQRRYVGRPRVQADGMARMSLLLPAEGAVTVMTALDTIATTARSAGDARTADQVRADALCEWAAGACREGWTFTACGRAVTSARSTVSVTVPISVLARQLPDFQPAPSLTDIHHAEITSEQPETGKPAGQFSGRTAGQASVDGQSGGVLPEGVRYEAAHLDGYGPIAPMIAVLLAADGVWRRLVTDPLTGLPLDVGRASYRPPAQLAEAIRVRDRTCVRPGCSVPASRTEADHVIPWARGGDTSAPNMVCLCARCHRIKTVGGGTPIPPTTAPGSTHVTGTSGSPGVTGSPGSPPARRWKSASGRTYTDREDSPDRSEPADRPEPVDRSEPTDRPEPVDRTKPTDRPEPVDRTLPTDQSKLADGNEPPDEPTPPPPF